MEKVVITLAVGEPFHCPFCGTQTNPPYVEGKDVELKTCRHLLYLGTTEGGFEYLNEKYRDLITEEMDEEELMGIEIHNAIHFSICDLPPSAFGIFIGYKV